ncbi:MAG: hypothetical protein LUB63_00800 [Oscillospiraceae bacterium]|nr:hypothetical protein [Oscillospiraceae bacterium]
MYVKGVFLGAAALLCACGGNQASLDEDMPLQMATCTLSDGQFLTVQQYTGDTLSAYTLRDGKKMLRVTSPISLDRITQDGYEICYPASLGQRASVPLGGTYTQQMLDILNDWAVSTA